MGTYLCPRSVTEALDALSLGLAEGRPRVIVAGATDHYPARVGRVLDEDILDISGLAESRLIRPLDGGWLIPALATWTDLATAPLPPLFAGLQAAARTIGGLQIQNRATVIGNLCNASPAADGTPNLLALDAVVVLASSRGERRIPVAEFVTGNRTTVRAADELVSGVRVEGSVDGDAGTRSTFLKLGSRAYLVISIAMVAVVLARDSTGRVKKARVAVGACSAVAQRLGTLEQALAGLPAQPGLGNAVRPEHLAALSPIGDVRGSATYRREAAETLVRRALEELVA